MCVCENIKSNDFLRFIFENKATKLLIREFYRFKYEFRRNVDLNECRFKRMLQKLISKLVFKHIFCH